jgi:hypothetical protein
MLRSMMSQQILVRPLSQMKASNAVQRFGRSGWLYLRGGIFRAPPSVPLALRKPHPIFCGRRQLVATKSLLTDGAIGMGQIYSFLQLATFFEESPASLWRAFELPACVRSKRKKLLRRAFDMMPL